MSTPKKKAAGRSYPRLFVYIGTICLLFLLGRIYFFDVYRVTANSMNNTLKDGDKVLVWKTTNIRHNAIVVFSHLSGVYIKRCAALPGDTILIRDGVVYINQVKIDYPSTIQSTTASVPARKSFDLLTFQQYNRYWDPYTLFGPLRVPFKGMRIDLISPDYPMYESIIEQEISTALKPSSGSNGINQKKDYIFKHDYYFMIGDNRTGSNDSRSGLGLIAEEEIIGKTNLVLYSFSDHSRLWKRVQ